MRVGEFVKKNNIELDHGERVRLGQQVGAYCRENKINHDPAHGSIPADYPEHAIEEIYTTTPSLG